jgi:hypothetical protein
MEFSRTYSIYILKRIPWNFSLHFYDFYFIFYEFLKFDKKKWDLNQKQNLEMDKHRNIA